MTLELITTTCGDKKELHLVKNCPQEGQNIKNFNFLDFHPFVDPLISDTPSLTGYDVNQCNLDDL